MNSRETILQAVLHNQPELTPLPDISIFKVKYPDIVQKYMDTFKSINGDVHLVSGLEEIKELMQQSFDLTKRIVTTLPEMNETFSLLLSQPSGALLGSDQLKVTILNDDSVPPLAWSGINWMGQEIHLRFASISGRLYRIERAPDMIAHAWSVVADNLPGTGGVVEMIDPNTSPTQQGFYRLVLLP